MGVGVTTNASRFNIPLEKTHNFQVPIMEGSIMKWRALLLACVHLVDVEAQSEDPANRLQLTQSCSVMKLTHAAPRD